MVNIGTMRRKLKERIILTLPIGIWLHGIIYEKCNDKLYSVFGIIALLTVLMSVRGKKVYLQLQNDSIT